MNSKLNLITILCLLLFTYSPWVPSARSSILESGQDWAQVGDIESATAFQKLYKNVKGFAGILLLIGVVLGGIFFVMGNTKIAIMILVAGVILYGGAYLIGIAANAFGVSGS